MLRVVLVCVGRVKAGAERELAARYFERAKAAGRGAGLAFEFLEIDESRARRPEDRKAEEAAAIRSATGTVTQMIALDERGTSIDSLSFASLLGHARDDGLSSIALLIGGPDGLAPEVLGEARKVIAFGALTWPHQLVRIMAMEQLYRAVTILTGHPYHRA